MPACHIDDARRRCLAFFYDPKLLDRRPSSPSLRTRQNRNLAHVCPFACKSISKPSQAKLPHGRRSSPEGYFATSIVTVLGSPKAEPSQPRALVGGHLVSTLVGLLVVKLCGPAPWAAAVAVGLAMVAMHLTGTFHPPAGIDPLAVVVNNMSWSFLIVPVGIGALLLATFAFAWHNLVTQGVNEGDTWPIRWW